MTAESTPPSERERMAAVVYAAILEEDDAYAWTSSTPAVVNVDGGVHTDKIADALIAAGFGDVARKATS